MERLRKLRAGELVKVAEFVDRSNYLKKTLTKRWSDKELDRIKFRLESNKLSTEQLKMTMEGGLLTYLLHCEARIASFLGRGYYTIGPSGEELLGFVGLNFKKYDLTALHYRHLATSISRQLQDQKSLEAIALDRARGFTCSIHDPVTTGRHCSIGGNHGTEYLVTSTLASQAPPALGRALGISLSNYLIGKQSNFHPDAISYVSVGDGSINNAHFLSALNLAKYSEHNKFKCPLVMAISDNRICISLKSTGYLDKFIQQQGDMCVRVADGRDFLDVYEKSREVVEYSRKYKRPSLLLFSELPRRFGHAATDRQFAYLTAAEIQEQINRDPLSDTFSQLIQAGIYTESEFESLLQSTIQMIEKAFDQADSEPKNTSREVLIASNSAPLAASSTPTSSEPRQRHFSVEKPATSSRGEVMRKHMTKVFEEILHTKSEVVYIGEDVEHGGYYLVTEGLKKKYPYKVRDFPPDETTLVGAGMGFSQAGLVPILEIPYAKYLDCGADMFYEAIISNWLSHQQQPNGMVVRLQGFDKGIFGGNYHTHNMLTIPPGLDVVCFSNGLDYVRGMRYAIEQAKQGRIVMSVDSTDLLNRRHLVEEMKDEFFLSQYPELGEMEKQQGSYHFDEITLYSYRPSSSSSSDTISPNNRRKIVIITYGNGVPTCAAAQVELSQKFGDRYEIVVIDTPCLSQTPKQLETFFQQQQSSIDYVLFADVCKYGVGMPLSARLADLQKSQLLQQTKNWRVIGAAPTYNPLGTYLTFLSKEDVLQSLEEMINASK